MERRQTRGPALLATLAVVVMAATVWATGAFGAGSTTPSSTPTNDGPVAENVQDATPATDGDCPEDGATAPSGTDSGSGTQPDSDVPDPSSSL
jgi:hypothetical protein